MFCGLLIIGVLIGIMIPLTGSAQPSENKIENYFCRAPQESLSNNKAALRFAFTTNTRKDPQYFGVVYSETSDRPIVGKDGCTVAPAWKVHSSANTTLDGHPAGRADTGSRSKSETSCTQITTTSTTSVPS